MAKTIGCGCYYCTSNGIRKDFRRDHGGGPEEIPHRKKGVGKKRCKRNKINGTHSFTKPVLVYVYKYDYKDEKYFKTLVTKYICEYCTKPPTYYFWR